MLYDSKRQECKPKDKVAEFIFGTTLTRSLQNLDKVSSCPQKCKKDAWCAGLNICKPITNSGQSCWSKKHQSCWCKSKCYTPMNKQAAGAAAAAIATTIIVVVAVASGVGVIVGGLVAMAAAAGATTTAALSLEAGRCSAGIDGLTLPGGANGNKHYIHIHEPGCNAGYVCPDHPDNSYYCPGGIYPKCKPAKSPGQNCMTNFHNWCRGHSKCLPSVFSIGISGICSAGKDGKNPVGKIYKDVPILKKEIKIQKLQKH